MVENVIVLMIYICLVVGLCYLVIWVLEQLGIAIPPKVIQIFWVIVVLIVILLVWRALSPLISGGGLHLFPK